MMCPTTDILEQKRKQLEQEIADFRSQKENEYKTFEWQLLKDVHDASGYAARQGKGGGPQKQGTATTPRKHWDHHGSFSTMTTHEAGPIAGNMSKFHDGTPADTSQPLLKDSKNLPEGVGGSLSRTQVHEREEEFQGLFTPSYLPLLDSKVKKESKAVAAGKLDLGNPDSTSSGLPEDLREGNGVQANPPYSSSASFPTIPLRSSLSPTPPRSLSGSVPRQPAHQRRSSSRSDTSLASLRSSLRDPSQPRSPKRVLFSIDNLVVSPSTSPLMQRTDAGAEPRPPDLDRASQSARDSMHADKRSKDGVWDVFPWVTAKSESTPTRGFASALTPQKPTMNTSLAISGEDFERIDGDDVLFAFDEDIGGHEQAGKGKKEEPEDGFESDEEEGTGSGLPASSPHAGSLPIEIKWPSRLGPNG